MKKLYILTTTLFSLLVISFSAFAQPAPAPTVLGRYDGPVGGTDEIRAMTIDAHGYVYVTGPSDASKKGNLDYATIKYNGTTGQQMWVARYNGTGNGEDWPYAIAVDAAGNVFVTGRSMGSGTNLDYATVKYDANGNQKWVARYNSPNNLNDVAHDIAVDAAGYVYVTGETDDAYALGSANSATTIKYDPSNGKAIRMDVYDALPNIYKGTNTNAELATSLAIDANGNVYVAGNSAGGFIIKYDTALNRRWVTNIAGSDIHKILVDPSANIFVTGFNGQTAKYDSLGTSLWQMTYNAAGFNDMVTDPSGNIYVTGNLGSDYLTVKYNSNGSQAWANSLNGSFNGTDFARSIALDGSGNVYVTGYYTVKSGRNGLTCAGTVKYDNGGVQKWVASYDSANNLTNDGFIVATDASGDVYVAGQGVSSSRANDYDFVTIKYSAGSPGFVTSRTSDVVENNNLTLSLKNYPNPFANTTMIEYQIPHDGNVKLSVYDLSGQEVTTLVNEKKRAGIYRVNFVAGKLSSGTYVCKIQCGDLSKTKQIIVIQ
jgi:hypothetical protein